MAPAQSTAGLAECPGPLRNRGRWCVLLLRRHGLFHVELQIDEAKSVSRHTAFVFMGNNEYEKAGLYIGARQRLDGGHLWLCLPRRGGRIDLLRLAVLALIGRLHDRAPRIPLLTGWVSRPEGVRLLRLAVAEQTTIMRRRLAARQAAE